MFASVGTYDASQSRHSHWSTPDNHIPASYRPSVDFFNTPAESDDDSWRGGLMPNQTRRTDQESSFPTPQQTSANFSAHPQVPLPPEDTWPPQTCNEYADDQPYVPPSINHSSDTSLPSEYRPPPSPFSYQAESQPYDYSHLGQNQRPGSSGSADTLSTRRDKTSSPRSSGESEVQPSGHTYEPSPPYPQPSPPNLQRPRIPVRYPAYNEHNQRIGLEHTRRDATEHISNGQSYYRPQTHNYGPISPPATRHSRRADAQRFSPPQPSRVPPSHATQHAPPPPAFQVPVEEIPNPEPMIRQSLGMGMESGPPLSLAVLDDPPPGEKPNYPYPTLTKLAIYGSDRKKLTLQEIYAALEERFEWFRERSTSDTAWKRSIRHLLSLNKTFRKVARPVTDPGKGSYWMVDYSQGEGNKRLRKRNKKPTKAQLAKQAAEESARQGQQPTPHGSMPGPSHGRSDSEDSHRSGQGISGGPDDWAIDPTLSTQGHRVGIRRSVPRTRVRANPPYNNRLSSSESSGSSESRRRLDSMKLAEHPPTLTQKPAFGRPSLGAPFPVAATPVPLTLPGNSSGSIPVTSPASFGISMTMESGASGRGFSGYQTTSFLQGRTLPAPTNERRAAASARSSNDKTPNLTMTLPPNRPTSQQRNESRSSENNENGSNTAPFSSPN